jgi:hypothetical protein
MDQLHWHLQGSAARPAQLRCVRDSLLHVAGLLRRGLRRGQHPRMLRPEGRHLPSIRWAVGLLHHTVGPRLHVHEAGYHRPLRTMRRDVQRREAVRGQWLCAWGEPMLPLPQSQTERVQRNVHQHPNRPEQLRRVWEALRAVDHVRGRYRHLCHLHPRMSKRNLHVSGRLVRLPRRMLPDDPFRLLLRARGSRHGDVGVSDGNAMLPGGGWVPRRSLLPDQHNTTGAALLLHGERLLLRSP